MIEKSNIRIARIHDYEKGRHWAIFDQDNIIHGPKNYSRTAALRVWIEKYGRYTLVDDLYGILTPSEFAAAVLKEREPAVEITDDMQALLNILPTRAKAAAEKLNWSAVKVIETARKLVELKLAHSSILELKPGPHPADKEELL